MNLRTDWFWLKKRVGPFPAFNVHSLPGTVVESWLNCEMDTDSKSHVRVDRMINSFRGELKKLEGHVVLVLHLDDAFSTDMSPTTLGCQEGEEEIPRIVE